MTLKKPFSEVVLDTLAGRKPEEVPAIEILQTIEKQTGFRVERLVESFRSVTTDILLSHVQRFERRQNAQRTQDTIVMQPEESIVIDRDPSPQESEEK